MPRMTVNNKTRASKITPELSLRLPRFLADFFFLERFCEAGQAAELQESRTA